MTPEAVQAALKKLPYERTTLAEIENRIADTSYLRLNDTVTICNLTLDNGYSVRGESDCGDPRRYDQRIGEKLARDQAIGHLWPLFKFMLAEIRHLRAA